VVSDFEGEEQMVLVGNGSEVSTLMQAAEKLYQEEGIVCRVVSVISEGLFRDQDEAYQASIIPEHLPKFGLTAGIPFSLRGLVGPAGVIHGVDHFGYSAPFTVLDEKFGFNPDFVAAEVKKMLAG
jgi:transketolase